MKKEKKLSWITLGLFQCILIFSPVIVLPMLVFTAISPISFFDVHLENKIIFISQVIFVTGCILRRQHLRILLKGIGFFGMIAAYLLLASATDTGGEIGAKDSQGIVISFLSGIPFLVAGVFMFRAASSENVRSRH